MSYLETKRNPVIQETGPKPLTEAGINYNINGLKDSIVKALESKSTSCSSMGIFRTASKYDNLGLYAQYYWSQELLRFEDQPHLLQINKYRNLEAYETQGEVFISRHMKPKIIIKPEEIRMVEQRIDGRVSPSGFVLPKEMPPYPLGGEKRLSPEEVEDKLIATQKTDAPQSSCHTEYGWAKVDPSLAGKDVLLILFKSDSVFADAVVIDQKQKLLVPRNFYIL